MYQEFDEITLKDGTEGIIVDQMGPDYVVDIGDNETNFDTILVRPDEIAGKTEKKK